MFFQMISLRRALRCAAVAVLVVAAPVLAQPVDPALLSQLSPEDRQKALQALQGARGETTDAPAKPVARAVRAQSPAAVAALNEAESEQGLPLFGYELFTRSGNDFRPSAEVPVPRDYVLGPGDIVRVQLFGNQNETLNLSVTRDGSVNFPRLGPIQVAGLSIDDAREVIDRRVGKELIGVQTNITLGPLRGMQVFVLGDANQPGAYSVSGLATISNALSEGGGIAPSGSLRRIELKRAGRTVRRIDLYDLLLRGSSASDVRMQAGDAVFIPPVGPRVAVSGAVNRPAVYEITGPITVKAALDMAGGLSAGALRVQAVLDRAGSGGQRVLRSIDLSDAAELRLTLKDGDRLKIGSLDDRAENPVTVIGHVRYESGFAWDEKLTLGRLLSLAQVRPSEPGRELYGLMALIERTNADTGLREWQGFDLAAVRSGALDENVRARDRVLVLTRSDVAYLMAPEVASALVGVLPSAIAEIKAEAETRSEIRSQEMLSAPAGSDLLPRSEAPARETAPKAVCPALLEVVKISDSARARNIRILLAAQANAAENRNAQAIQAAAKEAAEREADTGCPEVFRKAPTALTYLLENSAGLVGEVRQPGLYPFVPGTSMQRLLANAGGETGEADARAIEFFNGVGSEPDARFRKVPRDGAFAATPAVRAVYRFLPAQALAEVGTVSIRGEVRFPGRYVISRGERYSELIARAGGLNDNAYAYGTVFTRASARDQESAANRRAAADLRESLVNAATKGLSQQQGSATANTAVLDLVQRLETTPAVGRVVIEADPAVLGLKPGADFLLEPDDAITVPKRPNAVAVTGQVLSPGSLAFVSGASPEDYIRQAGGFAEAADAERAFLVLPNGIARPLKTSFWQYRQEAIPPGSVIVVPRDVAPYTALLLTERITTIVSNLALSAAALVTINR